MNNSTKTYLKKVAFRATKNPIHRRLYFAKISKRSNLPFTALASLAENIPTLSYYTPEINIQNDFYGHAAALKKFLGISPSYQFKFNLDHGVTFSRGANIIDPACKLPSVVTFGNLQKEFYEADGYPAFPIGPYIHYTPGLLDTSSLEKERKRLGSCLLVFPFHSTSVAPVEYDVKKFCMEIKKIAKGFKTVRVCLYWKDVLLGVDKYYTQEGFECVTAGHVFDTNFLPRLKSIIETSTYTASNSIGTHLGYCILLKKPHVVLTQKLSVGGPRDHQLIVKSEQTSKPYNDLLKEFITMKNDITKKQYNLVEYVWGFDQIKTAKEFLKILEKTEDIYSKK